MCVLPWPIPAALAQQPDGTLLPDVTVTAKGYLAETADTPIVTTTIDARELQRDGAQNLGMALRGKPGLAVNGDSAQGQNPLIRGLKRDSIVLMVDGVRFNSAQPIGAIASFMSLALADRVEVVKGPASVLYGTGALGGAIDVRLPQARFEQGLQGHGRLQYETANKGWLGSAHLNASEGDHALMVGAALGRFDDYRSPDGREVRTGYDSRTVIGQYRHRLGDGQQLRVSAQQHEDEDVWYRGSARPHANPRVDGTISHSPKQHRRLYEAGYNHRGHGVQPINVDLRVYRQEMRRTIHAWSTGLARDIATNDVTFATDGVDARADWRLNPQHLLSFGTNLWRMRANPDSRMAGPPTFAQFVSSNPFRDGEVRAIGVYLQDDMKLGDLSVLAGLRHDRVKGSASAMNDGQLTSGLERSDGATSGSLGLLYRIGPLLRPYINVSRAFRAADLRERYQSGLRNDGFYYAGSPQIEPETATQFELGMKGANERLDYSVSVFHNRIDDYITGTRLSGAEALAACGAANAVACRRTVNLGHVTLNGFEAGLRWRLSPGQWARLSYTAIRGKNNDLDEPLYQMPADMLTLGWQKRLHPRLSIDADWYLVRKQNRVATVFTRGTENATGGYGLVDIGAIWDFMPGRSLRLAIRNLGDKRYHEHLTEGISGREPAAPGRSLQIAWQGSF
ncbi:MAG: TonB-dependent receptor [Lautropia sp.]|nr:TonB-dependent receptor [Lautropia sp.]